MTHRYRILDPSHSNPEFAGKCALAIMAKAPRPGKVKTRLTPPLTSEQASELNACFLRDTVANLRAATQAALAKWVVSYTPAGEEAAFDDILPDGALLLPQRGENFGERLLATAEDLFHCGFSAVCLIDSDSPTVPTSQFVAAATALLREGERAVLGPSIDGGYYLLGMQNPIAELFHEIAWSTEVVASQTFDRAAEINLPVEVLWLWYDVDDGDSLGRLHDELLDPRYRLKRGYPAPHTHAYLAQIPTFAALCAAGTENTA